jgi:hypothetical protein
MTDWEQAVLHVLTSVAAPGLDVVLESLPYLVVTGGCECGCASFNVRDSRFSIPAHRLRHFSNGRTGDRSVGFALWVGKDGRPISVDVDNEPGVLPDPTTVVVSTP